MAGAKIEKKDNGKKSWGYFYKIFQLKA